MEHEMLLLDADFKVVARMTGRMKQKADVAQVAERFPRKEQGGSSSDSIGSIFEERE